MVNQTCINCGICFGVPDLYDAERRRDGKMFCCPNGHQQHYSETEVQKLKKQLETKEYELARAKERESYEWRRAQNAEKQATRAKNKLRRFEQRIAKGICPCCDRRFENLAQHMTEVHPEFADENPTLMRGIKGLLPAPGKSTVRS